MPRGLAQRHDQLTAEQREAAWRLAYRTSLDEHSDAEIAWEADLWRQHGAPSIAAVCDDLLAERGSAADQVMPGGAEPSDLDRLLARVDARSALRLVEDEALCLLAAMRLIYCVGLREVPR